MLLQGNRERVSIITAEMKRRSYRFDIIPIMGVSAGNMKKSGCRLIFPDQFMAQVSARGVSRGRLPGAVRHVPVSKTVRCRNKK